MFEVRDEQLVIQKPALEIFVPGRGLLYEQCSAFAETPISFERSSRVSFSNWGDQTDLHRYQRLHGA
jgi:hypothetical protein